MQGYVFVDRDGKHFRHILNWLRDGVVPTLTESKYIELLREAEYYQLLVSHSFFQPTNIHFFLRFEMNHHYYVEVVLLSACYLIMYASAFDLLLRFGVLWHYSDNIFAELCPFSFYYYDLSFAFYASEVIPLDPSLAFTNYLAFLIVFEE